MRYSITKKTPATDADITNELEALSGLGDTTTLTLSVRFLRSLVARIEADARELRGLRDDKDRLLKALDKADGELINSLPHDPNTFVMAHMEQAIRTMRSAAEEVRFSWQGTPNDRIFTSVGKHMSINPSFVPDEEVEH